MQQYSNALFTDLYELTMAQAYWHSGYTGQATFSLYFRGYPSNRAYYVCAGIEDVLDHLESFRFEDADIEYLRDLGRFNGAFLDFLSGVRFTGAVRAMKEGELCFSNEPLVEVTAPIIEAQLIETFILNQVTTDSTLATKASRVVHAAEGRSVVDFSARRTQGTDAANKAARAGYLVGYDGTSNVQAAALYGIPPVGTMAHSLIMAFENEIDSFRAYAATFPDSSTLLVDTYDTIEGVKNAITVALELAKSGHTLQAVRLDSGDMGKLAKQSRQLLDEAGLKTTRIIASGGLDEFEVAALIRSGAPIDGFGVGTKVGVSADAPYLDSTYKLVEYASRPVLKLSTSKETLPGPKQVYRTWSANGEYAGDVIARADEPAPKGAAEPLLHKVMSGGRRQVKHSDLEEARGRFRDGFQRLPAQHRDINDPQLYDVRVSDDLDALRASVTTEIEKRHGTG
ncbi:MAG: nicotinate phosphoribosyltransferase [Dehalococcoidia bacterium]